MVHNSVNLRAVHTCRMAEKLVNLLEKYTLKHVRKFLITYSIYKKKLFEI
jgi:hypothetical protein